MRNTFFFREAGRGWLIPLITAASFTFAAGNQSVLAQAITEEPVVVTAEEGVPSAYGAPPGFRAAVFPMR